MREAITTVDTSSSKNGTNIAPHAHDIEDNLQDLYEEEKIASDENAEYIQSQVSIEDREQIMIKNKTKLEKLLAQPDIFDCLRRINSGQIKSYEDLEINPVASKNDN